MPVDSKKAVVRRFNHDVIVRGDRAAFEALMAPDFVNRSALPGTADGPESMWNTFENVLRPALSGLTVTIHDQIAEGDKVTSRKTISGVHTGGLLGIAATNRPVAHGRYVEHWGINTLGAVLAALKAD